MMNVITCQDCDKKLAEFEGEFRIYGDMIISCQECINKKKVEIPQ